MFEAALLIALVGTIATLSQIHSTVAQQRALESMQLAAAAVPDDNAEPPREGYDNRVSVTCPPGGGSPGGSVVITGSGNVDIGNPNCTGKVQFTDPETGKTITMDTKQFQNITSACNQGTKECDKAFGDAGMEGFKPEDAKGFKNVFEVQASRVQAQREVSDIVDGAFREGPPALEQAYQQLAKPDLSAAEISSIRESLDTAGVLTGPLKESMDDLAIKNAQLEQLKDTIAVGGVARLDPSDPYTGGVPRTEAAFLGRTTHVEGTVTREPIRDTGTVLAEVPGEDAWGTAMKKGVTVMGGEPVVVPTDVAAVPGTFVDRGSALLGEVKEKVTDLWKWATGVTDGVARDDMYNVGMVPVGTRVVDGTGPFTAEDVAGVDSARRALTPATREFADGVFRDQRPVGSVELLDGTGVIDTVRTPAGTEDERAAALRIAREREAAEAERVARERAGAPAETPAARLVRERQEAEKRQLEQQAARELAERTRLERERAGQQTPPRGGIMDMLGGLFGGNNANSAQCQALKARCTSSDQSGCAAYAQQCNGQQQNPLQSLLGQLGKMLGGGSKGGGSGSGGSGSGQQQAQNTNGCSQYPGTTLQNGTCTCPSGQSWSGSACATQNPCATYAGTTYNQQANRCDCPTGQNYDGSRCVAVATADTLKAELSCAPKPPQVQDVDGPIAISWSCTGAAASKGDKFDTGNQMSGSTEIAATLPQGSASSANVTLALTCSKDGVQKVATCVVGVSKPFVALAATPSETTSGKTVKLAWVSGGMRDGDDACTITSDELPAFRKTGKSGLADTPNITEETTFDLKCTTKGGLTKEASATVKIR